MNYSIHFKRNKICDSDKDSLDQKIAIMKLYPALVVRVAGYTSSRKHMQKQSWNAVNAVVKYFVSKGIQENRILFAYPESGLQTVAVIISCNEIPVMPPPKLHN